MNTRLRIMLAAALLSPLVAPAAISTGPMIAGGATLSLTNMGYIFVDAGGNDSTAVPGKPSLPYASLTNAIAHVTDNTTLAIGPGTFYITPTNRLNTHVTSYAVNSPAQLTGKTNVAIVGSGPGTRIVLNGVGFGLVFANCTNVLVRDLVIQAPSHINLTNSGDYMATVFLRNTNAYMTFENVTIDGSPEHGIGHIAGPRISHDVTVQNCVFRDIGCTNHNTLTMDGAAISGIGSCWTVENCRFIDNLRDIEIESLDAGLDNPIHSVVARNNRHMQTLQKCYMVWPNITRNVHDVIIEGNIISNMVTRTCAISDRAAIHITGGDNIVVRNNIIDRVPVGDTSTTNAAYGVWAYASSAQIRGLQIHDNILRGIDLSPIYVLNSQNVTNVSIARNTIVNTDPSYYGESYRGPVSGIYVSGVTEVSICDNSFLNGAPGGRLINIGVSTREVVVARNVSMDNAGTDHYPDYGLWISSGAPVTNIVYYDNLFQRYAMRSVTNASYARSLPSTQFGWTAPSDTYDPAGNGSIFQSTNGGFYLRTNDVWQLIHAGPNSTVWPTNAAANGATLSMAVAQQLTNAAGNITFTGLTGTDDTQVQQTRLFITSAAQVTVTIPVSWRTDDADYDKLLNTTSNMVLTVTRYGNVLTNAEFKVMR